MGKQSARKHRRSIPCETGRVPRCSRREAPAEDLLVDDLEHVVGGPGFEVDADQVGWRLRVRRASDGKAWPWRSPEGERFAYGAARGGMI